ncbi:MAG: acetate--CoA ligase [Cyanobacteria bacterium P01_H01_bin.74]
MQNHNLINPQQSVSDTQFGQSYETAYQDFQWATAAKTLLGERAESNRFNQFSVCIARHAKASPTKTALLWHGKDNVREAYTFSALEAHALKFAQALKKLGIEKGDRVFIYMERIPEVFFSTFGILRAGAIVGPLFSAFGPEAILDRLQDSQAKAIVISSTLLPRLNAVRQLLPDLEHVIVVNRNPESNDKLKNKEYCYNALVEAESATEAGLPEITADCSSVMHYTSGTTAKPKGVLHRHQAVIAQAETSRMVLDLRPETDIYWCTADPGWVTGTSYGMFGPWALGCTMLVYEGGFDASKWYELIAFYKVSVWYTAPTAIRMLMKAGDNLPKQFDLSTLRHLCSVGEPLNPEAILWGKAILGRVFHDTWWQTETGSMHICNYPVMPVKPGSMGKPFPGTEAAILSDDWHSLGAGEEGHLAIKPLSPSMFKAYWQKEALTQSRFKNGWYITGDRARRDDDGYYWFVGRADDVINTAGHLVGPFEVENALVEHPAVAEAGVIGKPDKDRLEIIKAFVSLKVGYTPSEELAGEIKQFVRKRLSAHAYPRELSFVENLPKTRSGKIMRRLLKARELGLPEGDLSTLED